MPGQLKKNRQPERAHYLAILLRRVIEAINKLNQATVLQPL